ncbi:MAG: histidine kinase [Acutalibacteraceae bacterium]|nr:histidine kinase [Acutalibacteraceae bacterium]
MDTALKNGDFAKNESGKIYSISGMEETLQRCRILLTVKQGSFCYNRAFGNNLHTLSADDKNLQGNALLLVREALISIPQVQVNQVVPVVNDSEITLKITIGAYNQTAELEVNI